MAILQNCKQKPKSICYQRSIKFELQQFAHFTFDNGGNVAPKAKPFWPSSVIEAIIPSFL